MFETTIRMTSLSFGMHRGRLNRCWLKNNLLLFGQKKERTMKVFTFIYNIFENISVWHDGPFNENMIMNTRKVKKQHKNFVRVLTINKIGKVKSNWKEKVCLERRLEWHRTVHQLGYDVDRNLKIMTMTMTVMIMKLISTCRLSLLLMMWC